MSAFETASNTQQNCRKFFNLSKSKFYARIKEDGS